MEITRCRCCLILSFVLLCGLVPEVTAGVEETSGKRKKKEKNKLGVGVGVGQWCVHKEACHEEETGKCGNTNMCIFIPNLEVVQKFLR